MHMEAKNFFLQDRFIYGFPLQPGIAGNGNMEVTAEKIFAENASRIRPAGKSLVVRSINLAFLRPPEHDAKGEPPYAGLFRRGGKNATGGSIIGKAAIFRRHGKAGYCCSGAEVAFLPEFIETFVTRRHGISLLEVEETIAGLSVLPFIPDAAAILDQISKAAFSNDTGNLWIETKSLELLSVVLDWHRGRGALAPVNEQDRLGITQALRYAEERLAEPLVLRALAKQASMSKSKFTAVFKNHTGLSTAEYIRRLRMEKALDCIKNTALPLGEIAALVGYRKHSNFSQVFKRRYGVTPGMFRKRK
jgi:AraC-like DNA-binding protein